MKWCQAPGKDLFFRLENKWTQIHHQIFVSHEGHGLHRLPGLQTVPDARRQGVTTEGVSAILRREEPPQATQQAEPYGGSGWIFTFARKS